MFIPPVDFQILGEIMLMVRWRCFGRLWWPNTLLRHFMLVFPLICNMFSTYRHVSVVLWYIFFLNVNPCFYNKPKYVFWKPEISASGYEIGSLLASTLPLSALCTFFAFNIMASLLNQGLGFQRFHPTPLEIGQIRCSLVHCSGQFLTHFKSTFADFEQLKNYVSVANIRWLTEHFIPSIDIAILRHEHFSVAAVQMMSQVRWTQFHVITHHWMRL